MLDLVGRARGFEPSSKAQIIFLCVRFREGVVSSQMIDLL